MSAAGIAGGAAWRVRAARARPQPGRRNPIELVAALPARRLSDLVAPGAGSHALAESWASTDDRQTSKPGAGSS